MLQSPKNSSEISMLLKQIQDGTSLGERQYVIRQRCQCAKYRSRLLHLIEQRNQDRQDIRPDSPTTPSIQGVMKERDINRQKEIEALEDKILQYDKDNRFFSRFKKFEVLQFISQFLPWVEKINEHYSSMSESQYRDFMYDNKGKLLNVFSLSMSLLARGILVKALDPSFRQASASAFSYYRKLQDECYRAEFIKNFADEMRQDPDFFIMIFESRQFAKIFHPESFLARVLKDKLARYITGDFVLDVMIKDQKALMMAKVEHMLVFFQAQKQFLSYSHNESSLEKLDAAQALIASFDIGVNLESKGVQQDYAYKVLREEMKKRHLLKEITVDYYAQSSLNSLDEDSQRPMMMAQKLYYVFFSVVSGVELLAPHYPMHIRLLAEDLANVFCVDDQLMLKRVNRLMDLHRRVYAFLPHLQKKSTQKELSPKTNQAVLTVVEKTDEAIKDLHQFVLQRFDRYIDFSLAYGQQFVPVNIKLMSFSPFLQDMLLEASKPAKLPDYQFVQQLLTALATKDLSFTSRILLDFAMRHRLHRVFKKHASFLSHEVVVIWSQHAEASAHFGFDKDAVEHFEPVLKLLIEHGSDEQHFSAFVQVLSCIIEMIFAKLDEQPEVITLLDRIFDLLTECSSLRASLQSNPQARQGMLKFFRVLFKNNLLITNRIRAAIKIQSFIRGAQVRIRQSAHDLRSPKKQNNLTDTPYAEKGLTVDVEETQPLLALDKPYTPGDQVVDFTSIPNEAWCRVSDEDWEDSVSVSSWETALSNLDVDSVPAYQAYIEEKANEYAKFSLSDGKFEYPSSVREPVGYDHAKDVRSNPSNLGMWERFQRWFAGKILQFFMKNPGRLLWALDTLSQNPDHDGSQFLSFSAFLRARVGVNTETRALLGKLKRSIHLIIEVNPLFWQVLSSNNDNYGALYRLLKVLCNPNIPNNSPEAIDAIEKLFETVQDYAVTRSETYPAVQALLSIWLAPEEFENRCERVEQSLQQRSLKLDQTEDMSLSQKEGLFVSTTKIQPVFKKSPRNVLVKSRPSRPRSNSSPSLAHYQPKKKRD